MEDGPWMKIRISVIENGGSSLATGMLVYQRVTIFNYPSELLTTHLVRCHDRHDPTKIIFSASVGT